MHVDIGDTCRPQTKLSCKHMCSLSRWGDNSADVYGLAWLLSHGRYRHFDWLFTELHLFK